MTSLEILIKKGLQKELECFYKKEKPFSFQVRKYLDSEIQLHFCDHSSHIPLSTASVVSFLFTKLEEAMRFPFEQEDLLKFKEKCDTYPDKLYDEIRKAILHENRLAIIAAIIAVPQPSQEEVEQVSATLQNLLMQLEKAELSINQLKSERNLLNLNNLLELETYSRHFKAVADIMSNEVYLLSESRDIQFIVEFIDKKIKIWIFLKQKQRAGLLLGSYLDSDLLDIQLYAQKTFNLLLTNSSHLRQFQQLLLEPFTEMNPEYVQNVVIKMNSVLEKFLNICCVATVQPQSVIKTSKFKDTPEVSLLVHNEKLENNVQYVVGSLSAWIISEESVPHFRTCSDELKVLHKEVPLVFNHKYKRISATFPRLQLFNTKKFEKEVDPLTKIRRAKGTEERAAEKKFCLVFRGIVTFEEQEFEISTISTPSVISMHTKSQGPAAERNMVWLNASLSFGCDPFKVPKEAHCGSLLVAISDKFSADTGCQLSEDNLEFLRNKFPEAETITWTQFFRDQLPGLKTKKTFSLFEWIYAALTFIVSKLALKDIFKAKHLMGFVSKEKATQILLGSEPGMFLLRFSESQLNSLTLAYVTSKRDVDVVAGTSGEIFNYIRDSKDLTLVYPKTPKNDAFQKMYSTTNEDGYTKLVCVLETKVNIQNTSEILSPSVPLQHPTQDVNINQNAGFKQNFPELSPTWLLVTQYPTWSTQDEFNAQPVGLPPFRETFISNGKNVGEQQKMSGSDPIFESHDNTAHLTPQDTTLLEYDFSNLFEEINRESMDTL